MIELKLGETITLECHQHGVIAEGVTKDNLSPAEQAHREAFNCVCIIHTKIVNELLDKLKKLNEEYGLS